MTTATNLLRSAAKREGALHGKGHSCSCCCDYGSTKSGRRNRQQARRRQRRIERRTWKVDFA